MCFNHCSIFRSDDDECIFSRKLILEYVNEEMRFILLLKIIYRYICIYVMHMSEFVFCQTQISVPHISAYENDFHLKF